VRIVESGRLGPRRVLSIAELVGGVRELVEELGPVWVVGEISNLRRAGSGHAYFTLKDDDA
jgi:exodeoxyribonuclease VII large subunit